MAAAFYRAARWFFHSNPTIAIIEKASDMIHTNRSRVTEPAFFKSKERKDEIERLKLLFARADVSTAYAISTSPFYSRFCKDPEIGQALQDLFFNKCAYCESPIEQSAGVAIEHFRPKSRAVNSNGEVSTNHYWWLTYHWFNLYLACDVCATMKSNRFPVKGKRAPLNADEEELEKEAAMLLDPCRHQPEEHFVFEPTGEVASKTDKGKSTIKICGLNRLILIGRRAEAFESLYQKLLNQMGASAADEKHIFSFDRRKVNRQLFLKNKQLRLLLKENFGVSNTYAAMRRQFVKQWLHRGGIDNWKEFLGEDSTVITVSEAELKETVKEFRSQAELQEVYSVEVDNEEQKEAYYSGAKRIERIEITNFKALGKLELTFPPPGSEQESWMMLLGENATGKSSVLQAVALALMGEQHSNSLGLNASRFVNNYSRNGCGSVKVYLTNLLKPVVMTFHLRSKLFRVEPKEPKVLLLGYGASRLLPRDTKNEENTEKHIRIKNLFSPTAPLNDAERWLANKRSVSDARFKEVTRTLKDLLMLDKKVRFERKSGKVGVRILDGSVCLHDLSDGFQSVVALCTDIMISLLERWDDMQIAEGIVLLDEIEVHLHPSWKIEIVARLRRAFPRVAFLSTTHDPLCLKGLNSNEIVVLRRDDRKRIYAMSDVSAVEDLRADQILTSPLFDLRSTRGRTPPAIRRYTELLQKKNKTRRENVEINELTRKLNQMVGPAGDAVQQLAQQALRTAVKRSNSRKNVKPAPAKALARLSPEIEIEIKKELARLLRK